jgi:tripartite-type tricarboxylate transporter receptor subunit TctC
MTAYAVLVPSLLSLSIVLAAPALAQQPPSLPGNYPSKPVKLLVGGTPGGGTDIIARALSQKLSESWGRQFVVENHASALGSIIAMELTAKAPPDGYTLHLASSSAYMNAALVTKVAYNIRTAFAAIAQLNQQPYVLVANNAVPAASVKEFIAYAASRKGAVNYGSSGTGTASHLGMELFKSMAKVDMQHIPYKGSGQAYVDLLGGRIQLLFSSAISAMPQAKTGKVRALGQGSVKRSKLLSDIPTISESGLPGFELVGWYGLIGTGGMPAPVVAALNKESVQIMNSPDMQSKLAADGAEAAEPHTPAQFTKAINDEIDRWDKLIKTSNLKFETN